MPANLPPSIPGTDEPRYYPLFLDIAGRKCVVIGGGGVAERKVTMLLKFKASVTVIAPVVTNRLSLLDDSGAIHIHRRGYRKGDLDNAVIVFACTDDRETNGRVKTDAAGRIPVNVVDKPRECDFIVPAIVKKGDVTIAISTSGLLPLASKKMRQTIEKTVMKDYAAYTRIIGSFRQHLMKTVADGSKRKAIMKAVGKMDMQEIIRAGKRGMKKILGDMVK